MTGLDETLSSPVRLRICGYLAGCEEADFRAVQDYCGMTVSNLSKQATILIERGYLSLRKVQEGRYVKTRLSLTSEGRRAVASHVAALQEIVDHAVDAPGVSDAAARS